MKNALTDAQAAVRMTHALAANWKKRLTEEGGSLMCLGMGLHGRITDQEYAQLYKQAARTAIPEAYRAMVRRSVTPEISSKILASENWMAALDAAQSSFIEKVLDPIANGTHFWSPALTEDFGIFVGSKRPPTGARFVEVFLLFGVHWPGSFSFSWEANLVYLKEEPVTILDHQTPTKEPTYVLS